MLARQSIFCNYRLLIFFSLFFRICSFTIRVPGFGAVELDLNYVCECDCGKPSMAVSHFEWNFCAWTLCLEWCNHQKDRCKTWRTSLECESGSKREKNKASMATSLEKKVSPSFPHAIISLSLEMILKIEPRNSEDLLGTQILFQLLKKSLQIFLFLLPPRPSPSRFYVHKYPETFIFFPSWIKIKEIRLLFLWVAFS